MEALEREVNNGGYSQFFLNSSRKFAPSIVQALQRIGCDAAAVLTAKALDALKLDKITATAVRAAIRKPNSKRDQVLDACNKDFYQLREIEPKLFAFVKSHPDKFVLEKTTAPARPRRRPSNMIALLQRLDLARPVERSYESVRTLASELAAKDGIAATENELDRATYRHLVKSFMDSGDFDECEALGGRLLELSGSSDCFLLWWLVEKFIAASAHAHADRVSGRYLRRLASVEGPPEIIRKVVAFAAYGLRQHLDSLPDAAQFLRANFPKALA